MSEETLCYALYAIACTLAIGAEVALLAHTLAISMGGAKKPEHMKRYFKRRRLCWLMIMAQCIYWLILQSAFN